MEPIIYYGQNREDLILSAFFPSRSKGFYVDIGACHPIKYSVTQYFYERGWHGINVEPQAKEFSLLEKKRRRDTNLRIGISNRSGKMKLRVYENESLSTLSKDIKEEYSHDSERKKLSYRDESIEVRTLAEIFQDNRVESIQFLKVDVEGHESEVLQGNNWQKYRPEVMCIEANNSVKAEEWRNLIDKVGYEKVFFDGLNDYYVEKESSLKDIFLIEYQKIIVSRPSLSYEWKVQVDRVVKQLEKVQATLDAYVIENAHLKQQVELIKVKESFHKRLRRHAKKIVKHIPKQEQ